MSGVPERLRRLQSLRNIGPKMAADLLSLGIETPEQMLEANPEALYEQLRLRNGGQARPLRPLRLPRREVRHPVAQVHGPVQPAMQSAIRAHS